MEKEVRVVGRQTSAPGAVQVDRRAEPLGEGRQLRRRVVPPDRAARHDHRPGSLLQQLNRAIDVRRIARLPRPRAIAGRQRALAVLDSVGEHIPGQLEKDRPRPPGQHGAKGLRHVRRHPIRRGHAVRPLGDAGEEVDLLHLLQRALPGVEAGRRAAEQQHRTVGGVRIGDPGQRIGDAGAGGDRADADPAGEPRRRVGGVGRGLLVPRVDQLDAFLDARRVDRRDVQPRKREDVPDAFGLQHAHEKLRAGRGCHQCLTAPRACPPRCRPACVPTRSG